MKKVEDNEDLVTVLLLGLPAKSIFRFRCVSKRWNLIISSPFFLESYYRIRKERMHLVGYIQSQNYEAVSSGNVEDSANILPMPPTNDYKIDTSIKLDYKFLCSCDGLLLFRYLKKKRRRYGYCILNPLTNRSITVPKPPKKARAAVLVCDDQLENLVLNYKVVVAGLMENGSSVTIQTFSSKTGKWTISTLNATGYFNFLHWKEPFVENGIIYWYTVSSSIAVYDTRTFIDDDTRKHLQLIELPGKREVTVEYNTVRSSSSPDDALWLCANIQHLKEIKMWMLPYDQYERYKKRSTTIPRTEWILMHNISD